MAKGALAPLVLVTSAAGSLHARWSIFVCQHLCPYGAPRMHGGSPRRGEGHATAWATTTTVGSSRGSHMMAAYT
eukprot:CAMPEP_0179168230 /NCGR_PEP_ID=MMETSP0796-20121207/82747_1 /TAXON_ID=73915 /ORGANISM="Pyrodinium bahamense, Strain pbaha01" /LENGTH=73 /DNA_ID=CAMNT_0020870983 /DNA_START=34 /DNA_END=252 /DNA_ORIENTATION=+